MKASSGFSDGFTINTPKLCGLLAQNSGDQGPLGGHSVSAAGKINSRWAELYMDDIKAR